MLTIRRQIIETIADRSIGRRIVAVCSDFFLSAFFLNVFTAGLATVRVPICPLVKAKLVWNSTS